MSFQNKTKKKINFFKKLFTRNEQNNTSCKFFENDEEFLKMFENAR